MNQSMRKPDAIRYSNRDIGFVREVNRRSGQCISLCWHCKTCSGGCPFTESMDFYPNEVIRLAN